MSIKRNMYVIFVVALLIGGTFSTSSLNFNLDLDLNNEFTNSKDELETFINDKCNENGANTTFSFLMNTTFELNMCTQTHFNIAEVQHELNIARTNGTMDEVVLKYCLRYPQIDKCLRKGYDAVKTCLNSTEQAIVQESLKFAGDLIKQMCLKDGTRLAMFIGYEGVECLNVQKEHLQECVMDSVGNNTEYVVILHQLFVSNDDNQRCKSFTRIRSCFYEQLSKCEKSIPANIIDGIFKVFRRDWSCEVNYQTRSGYRNDIFIRIVVTFVIILVACYVCYILAKQ